MKGLVRYFVAIRSGVEVWLSPNETDDLFLKCITLGKFSIHPG